MNRRIELLRQCMIFLKDKSNVDLLGVLSCLMAECACRKMVSVSLGEKLAQKVGTYLRLSDEDLAEIPEHLKEKP